LRREVLWRPALRIVPFVLVGWRSGLGARVSGSTDGRALGVTIAAISPGTCAPTLQTNEAPLRDGVTGLLGDSRRSLQHRRPDHVAHLYRRPDPPQALKATNQLVFLSMGLARLPAATAQGQITSSIWVEAAIIAPFVLAGLLVGTRLGRRISPGAFRRVSWLALGAMGVALVASP
jgi:uncharacterized membrane protein YfcA